LMEKKKASGLLLIFSELSVLRLIQTTDWL